MEKMEERANAMINNLERTGLYFILGIINEWMCYGLRNAFNFINNFYLNYVYRKIRLLD